MDTNTIAGNDNMSSTGKEKISKKEWKLTFINFVLCPFFTALLLQLFSFFGDSINNYSETIVENKTNIEKIIDLTSNLSTNVEKITESQDDLEEKMTSNYFNLDKRLAVIEDRFGLYTAKIYPSDELMNYINETFVNDNAPIINTTSIYDLPILGKNFDTGESCILENLSSQSILTQYEKGDEDIVFYGEINSNNFWDGNCIVNVYNNGSLKSIIDATYDNGILKSYKQVLRFVAGSNTEVWSISIREKEIDYDSGESWHYVYQDFPINFDIESISEDNIISADMFEKFIKEKSYLEGYYCGNITNNYHDKTGNAQRIKYSKDGYITMLYVGNFEDGNITDYTGNAWYIILGYDNVTYYYYKGRFENDERIDNTEPVKISLDGINELIKDIHFNCKLQWKEK